LSIAHHNEEKGKAMLHAPQNVNVTNASTTEIRPSVAEMHVVKAV
jgi:hypothetical protein